MSVSQTYREVIDDVIKNVKADFVDNNVDETILLQIKQLWESKLAEAGILSFYGQEEGGASSEYPYDAMNNYYPDAYASHMPPPSDYSNFLPASHPPPQAYPRFPSEYYAAPAGSSKSLPNTHHEYDGKPSPYMPPPGWQDADMPGAVSLAGLSSSMLHQAAYNQYAAQQAGGNAFESIRRDLAQAAAASNNHPRGGPRGNDKGLPQYDGSSDLPTTTLASSPAGASSKWEEAKRVDFVISQQLTSSGSSRTGSKCLDGARVPQLDGANDEFRRGARPGNQAAFPPSRYATEALEQRRTDDDFEADEEPARPPPQRSAEAEGDEEALGSDLDESEEDDDPDTEHIILAQFDKVTRCKNKWKCNLSQGIMHLNGRDYLFGKANGEFEW